MSRPKMDDLFVKAASRIWSFESHTFVLMNGRLSHKGFVVRVFEHYSRSTFWLPGGPWKSEGDAAIGILDYLHIK